MLARILQGIGAGGMISVSQAIIGDIVPPRERGRYQGYFSSMYAVASVAGPVLGGYMTEYLSWRWVFLINIPLGLGAWLVAHRTLVGLPVPQRKPIIDYFGTLLMIIGLTALLLGITQVGQGHSWRSTEVSGLLGCAVVVLAVFVWHERRAREPLLPMHLFTNRSAILCWCTIFLHQFPGDFLDRADAPSLPERHRRRGRQRCAASVAAGHGFADRRVFRRTPDLGERSL